MTLPLLQWREEHRIGIDALDFEHQDLFRRIDELLDDFARREERAEIEACLGEIHARMAAHFALEEKFMRDRGYADYAEHRAQHDRFLDDFVVAMAEFENDPGACASETLEHDLKRWILDHVLTADKRMSAMTRSQKGGT
jgi:hemerythrin